MSWFDWGQNDRIEHKLDDLLRRVKTMAIDQEAFDDALTAFVTDLEEGIAKIQAKLDGTGIDLTTELQQITDARAHFDTLVSGVEPPAQPE